MRCIIISLLILLFSIVYINGLPAFPGAEGWGADNVGGRGGQVVLVTTLNWTGPGSFLAALARRAPRIIVFTVSGVINNQTSGFQLHGPYSNVTIAGQTSPGGITLTGDMAGKSIINCYQKCKDQGQFHDGVFRFLRLWCTCANSSSGQTYGTLIAYADINRITMHHNLWANHVNRFPHMHWGSAAAPDQGLIDYRNNVCFNWQIYTLSICCVSGDLKFNVVGNYFKCGNQSGSKPHPGVSGIPGGQLYTNDNIFHNLGGSPTQHDLGGSRSSANDMPAVTTESAANAYESVLDKVGAWPRDIMNMRTVAEVRAGTGQYTKDNDPKITTGPPPPADSDLDGMPDYWEDGMGFNKNDYNDNTGDHDSDGYTNIEEYVNDLALVLLGESPHNPATGIDEVRAGNTGAIPNLALTVHPNPMTTSAIAKIVLRSNNGDRPTGSIQIYDLGGRLVKTFAPHHNIRWKTEDSMGRPLAPGTYLVKWMQGKSVRAVRRIMLLP
jgi:hypothetical protein